MLSPRDYVNTCVGYQSQLKREEFYQRELNYNVVRGWANPKDLPSKYSFWPIKGETIPKANTLTKTDINRLDGLFRSLSKKDGQSTTNG